MAETIIAICLSILVLSLVALLFFWAGVRYAASSMLPKIMARKTERELDELAYAVEAEREAMGLDNGDEDDEAA